MTVVLDVSAALQIALRKAKRARFEEPYEQAAWVIAPELYKAEITNALLKYRLAGILEPEQCLAYVQEGLELVDDFFPETDSWKEVLAEAMKRRHPAYDLFYAVLARRNDAVLLSDDARLRAVAAEMGVQVAG